MKDRSLSALFVGIGDRWLSPCVRSHTYQLRGTYGSIASSVCVCCRDGGLDEEPASSWKCSEAPTHLALLTPPLSSVPAAAISPVAVTLGPPSMPGMVSEALGPAAQPPFIPRELLVACGDLDAQVRGMGRLKD